MGVLHWNASVSVGSSPETHSTFETLLEQECEMSILTAFPFVCGHAMLFSKLLCCLDIFD